jgi:hypothetical protein
MPLKSIPIKDSAVNTPPARRPPPIALQTIMTTKTQDITLAGIARELAKIAAAQHQCAEQLTAPWLTSWRHRPTPTQSRVQPTGTASRTVTVILQAICEITCASTCAAGERHKNASLKLVNQLLGHLLK